jgi:O-antigen/teichoic acid export membrane protein
MNYLAIFPVVIVILHLFDKWLLAKGKLLPVYILTLIGASIAIVFNILLTIEGKAPSTVSLFTISSGWTIVMALKGLGRLRKERHEIRN